MLLKKQLIHLAQIGALFCLVAGLAFAQDGSGRVLIPGETVVGVVNDNNAAQVYAFTADAGNIDLQITADEGLVLTVIITDAQGNLIAQATDIANSGVVGFTNITLPAAGTYYVTIFPAAGTETVLTGSFTVLLEGDSIGATEPTAAPTQETVDSGTPREFQIGEIITTGIEVNLSWATTSDLNLQVRDPVARTLFYDSTSTDNGGTFGFDVNGLCEVLTDEGTTAVETASWAAGGVATGSYEILVYYRQDCEGVGAVPFTVDITVGDQTLPPLEAVLQSPANNTASVYLASFIINPDGTIEYGPQGQYTDTRVLPEPAQTYLDAPATTLTPDVVQAGLITSDVYYEVYNFTAVANDIVTISMSAVDGNLDTLLLVLDQNGRIIADNDDVVAADNTDSTIQNLRLTTDGNYTVIATRYGKDVGGTEGNYQLLLSSATADLPAEVVNLNLPSGDIEVTLTWNTNADLQLLVRDPGGFAVFDDERQIDSGGSLVSTGNIGCTVSATTPPAYYIYWPTGRLRTGSYEVDVWYQNDCGDTTPVTATLYIRVAGELLFQQDIAMQPDDTFLTSFTIDPSGNPSVGDSGIIGGVETIDFTSKAAKPILYGSVENGAILPGNKFDVFTFVGTAGDVVTINMSRSNGSLDTLLYLIGPDGFEVASNDDAAPGENTDSSIRELTLPLTGTYTIIATHYGTIYGGTTGGYSLTLSRDEE